MKENARLKHDKKVNRRSAHYMAKSTFSTTISLPLQKLNDSKLL
jgi:hypothetical protein